eukprot:1192300-Prorocentrum_minimum.AAC.5
MIDSEAGPPPSDVLCYGKKIKYVLRKITGRSYLPMSLNSAHQFTCIETTLLTHTYQRPTPDCACRCARTVRFAGGERVCLYGVQVHGRSTGPEGPSDLSALHARAQPHGRHAVPLRMPHPVGLQKDIKPLTRPLPTAEFGSPHELSWASSGGRQGV